MKLFTEYYFIYDIYPWLFNEVITFVQQDLQKNKTAKGCRRHTSGSCETPHESTYKFGLIIPLVALLIAVILLGTYSF